MSETTPNSSVKLLTETVDSAVSAGLDPTRRYDRTFSGNDMNGEHQDVYQVTSQASGPEAVRVDLAVGRKTNVGRGNSQVVYSESAYFNQESGSLDQTHGFMVNRSTYDSRYDKDQKGVVKQLTGERATRAREIIQLRVAAKLGAKVLEKATNDVETATNIGR